MTVISYGVLIGKSARMGTYCFHNGKGKVHPRIGHEKEE
jgi:hypothetical protein